MVDKARGIDLCVLSVGLCIFEQAPVPRSAVWEDLVSGTALSVGLGLRFLFY